MLSSYELHDAIGIGAMGHVYRAHDTKLGRDVAIKVLPEMFSQDERRVARFEREAQLLAALKHPGIATLYGLEESEGTRFLVMELVDGETLAERLSRGPIPLDQALPLFIQIGEALEAAHEKGIVHRDLKPANVKITPEGRTKLLDFGLAKAVAEEGTDDSGLRTRVRATGAGVILGTAPYMSPEQARGKTVDNRTDIWAFGCGLFESLTGEAVFGSDTLSDTLAKILTQEPDWQSLPWATPAIVRSLLRRCLAKDPRHRLQHIGDARVEIEEGLAELESSALLDSSPAVSPAVVPRQRYVWTISSLLAVGALALVLNVLRQDPQPVQSFSYQVLPPEGASFGAMALSPDARHLAFVGRGETSQLWVRSLESLETRSLAETEAADYPFWSPNSRSIGFFCHGELKTVSVSGGSPRTLCEAGEPAGGTWSEDDLILFASGDRLYRIPAAGGTREALSRVDRPRGDVAHRWPQFLPGGRHFLYLIKSTNTENSRIVMGSLDGSMMESIMPSRVSARYAAPGYLLFSRERRLFAQSFDPSSRKLTGTAVQLADDVGTDRREHASISSSSTGVLAYGVGTSGSGELVWLDREGHSLGKVESFPVEFFPRLSPDGQRIAAVIDDLRARTADIWIYDFQQEVATRLTFNPAPDAIPVWSPDARFVVFQSARDGAWNLYRKSASGMGDAELLLASESDDTANDWSRDGRYVLFHRRKPGESADIAVMDLADVGEEPRLLVGTPHDERFARFSPDGRWVAFQSNESGRDEIYVIPFLGSGKRQVSLSGGHQPTWRDDGAELFYRSPDEWTMAVEVTERDGTIEFGATRRLFRAPSLVPGPSYDVSADGERFLMLTRTEEEPTPLTVVVNWSSKLQE